MSDFRSDIVVIDYGMGNLHSVAKALEHVSSVARVTVTSDVNRIDEADRLVFPGVGGMRDCMAAIQKLDIGRIVRKAVREKPVLAICVGMQALLDFSEENHGVDCLGIVPGQVRQLGPGLSDGNGARLKVPHMGWDRVSQTADHPMWSGIDQDSRFYFVHSFYVDPEDNDCVAGTCDYGLRFAAALHRHNLFAAQFHPEKSAGAGLQLLKNFATWTGD